MEGELLHVCFCRTLCAFKRGIQPLKVANSLSPPSSHSAAPPDFSVKGVSTRNGGEKTVARGSLLSSLYFPRKIMSSCFYNGKS